MLPFLQKGVSLREIHIDLQGDKYEIKWDGISNGESWCRGSLIHINESYGRVGKCVSSFDELSGMNYFDYRRLRVESPTEMAQFLKNAIKITDNSLRESSPSECWKVNMGCSEGSYMLFLDTISIDDLIDELENVASVALRAGKTLYWV